MRAFWYAAVTLAVVSCGDDKKGTTPVDGHAVDAKVIDAAIDAPPVDAADPTNADYVIGGASSSQTNGVANALRWDGTKLYLTDSNANTLNSFDDTNHCCGIVRPLPAPALTTTGVSLGDIVKNADGSFLVAFFGFGVEGLLINVPATGAATKLTGMDATRRRIGLAKAPDGTLYESYFTGGGMMAQTGGVAKVTITAGVATETVVATEASTGVNFKKLVGLVATDTAVFVAQQGNPITTTADNKIFKIDVTTTPATVTLVAGDLPAADLLAMLPNGDLLTGGGAKITRITQAGVVTDVTPAGTFTAIHGIAYDDAKHRLFFINHSTTVGTPDKLHIRPFTP